MSATSLENATMDAKIETERRKLQATITFVTELKNDLESLIHDFPQLADEMTVRMIDGLKQKIAHSCDMLAKTTKPILYPDEINEKQ